MEAVTSEAQENLISLNGALFNLHMHLRAIKRHRVRTVAC